MRLVMVLLIFVLVLFASTSLFLLIPNLPAYWSDTQKTILISSIILVVAIVLMLIARGGK